MNEILERIRPELAGRYEIERELGHGSNAVVYLATERRYRRAVAVKVLLDDVDDVRRRRFELEIEVIAPLAHPHIIPLHDSGEAGGLLYYVMPRVDGPSLRERLRYEPRLPLDETARIVAEVASALSYAHANKVVHRDIKPENILISAGGAMVADFGIARVVAATSGAPLTQRGMTVGTPAYMSPEQARAERRLDGRCDLYSLACVAYEMLIGRPPFTSEDPNEVLRRQILDLPPTVRAARAEVPAELDDVLQKALAKKRGERYPTAIRFAEEFARAAGLSAPTLTATVPPYRRSLAIRMAELVRRFT